MKVEVGFDQRVLYVVALQPHDPNLCDAFGLSIFQTNHQPHPLKNNTVMALSHVNTPTVSVAVAPAPAPTPAPAPLHPFPLYLLYPQKMAPFNLQVSDSVH